MAKQNKSGLGRGLNSLLSGSMEEALPAETIAPVQRTMVKADEDVLSPKPSQKPTPAKQSISEKKSQYSEAISQENPVVSKNENESGNEKHQPYIEEEDHITIKGVVEREVKEKKIDEVDLNSIEPNPDQPRTYFKQEEIEELATSIERDGLLQPILVRSIAKGRYQIIAGERRWQACKSLGLKTVPIRIKEADDDKALELALIENIQRSDLNPIEEAYGYRRLMERQNMTQSEVAQAVSKGRSTIANSLRLLELPEDAQQLLFEEKISAGHARAILSIPSHISISSPSTISLIISKLPVIIAA